MDISIKACCKINIGLNVVSRREDGYHNLETIFYPVPLYDDIRVTSADRDGIHLEGIALDGNPDDNLVLRAVRLLRDGGHDVPPVHISLRKNIPSGAGLGGGSSDAACVLKALNSHLGLGLGTGGMQRMLAGLGADCPFFVECKPVYAEGIGDVFSPVELDLGGWHLVLVKPDEHISTKEAYASVRPKPSSSPLTEDVMLPVEEWKGRIANDFEASVFPSHPRVSDIRGRLYSMGASYACMSGSGSTVFGLFRRPVDVSRDFGDCFKFQCVL